MTSRDLALLPFAVGMLLLDAVAFAWLRQWAAMTLYLALVAVPIARKHWDDYQAERIIRPRTRSAWHEY